jgi:protease-4
MKNRDNQDSYILAGGAIIVLFLLAIIIVAGFGFSAFNGCVGVIEIKGELVSEDIDATLFTDEVKGSATMAEEIKEANERADVKSVLFIIDSPGGSVVASKQVYDAIGGLGKPSVSYINELAASGGYMAAAGTDYIVANPNAITGSIGARSTFDDLSVLFQKVGYNMTVVKSGELKDMGSPARPLSEKELAVMQEIVDESFQEFKSAVVDGRGDRLDPSGFAVALDGRLLTGRQAKKIGLVDELGGKEAAIAAAGRMAGIEGEPSLCKISLREGNRGIFGSLSSQAFEAAARAALALPKFSYR